jgi:hypothetical protein
LRRRCRRRLDRATPKRSHRVCQPLGSPADPRAPCPPEEPIGSLPPYGRGLDTAPWLPILVHLMRSEKILERLANTSSSFVPLFWIPHPREGRSERGEGGWGSQNPAAQSRTQVRTGPRRPACKSERSFGDSPEGAAQVGKPPNERTHMAIFLCDIRRGTQPPTLASSTLRGAKAITLQPVRTQPPSREFGPPPPCGPWARSRARS